MNERRPQVVHVIHHDGPGGGPLSVISQLSLLAAHADQAVIYGGAGRIAAHCAATGIPHIRASLERKRTLPLALLQCIGTLLRRRPDLVILHGQWAGCVGALAAWIARVPRRIYIARWPAFYADWDLLRCARNRIAERIACGLSHRIICLTSSSRYQYLLRNLAPEDRFVVVSNMLPAEGAPSAARIAALRARHGFDRFSCNVISVGRLVQQKKSEWLLHAWHRVAAACPAAHLWIVGKGPRQAALVESCRSFGLESSVSWIEDDAFTGAEYIAAGDLLAHTALFETFGNVVLEAMGSGKPVVSTDVDGPRSILTDSVDGFLVPPADSDAFSSSLIRLIQDPALRDAMGQAGCAAAGSYTPERVGPLLLDALALSRPPRIAHLIHHDGPGGGPPIVASLMRYLAPSFAQSAIGGGRGLIARFCERAGLDYASLRIVRPSAWLAAAPALWRRLRRARPDILVLHGQPAGLVGAVVGRLCGIRRMIYVAQWPAFYTDWDWRRLLRNRVCEKVACALADTIVTFTLSSRHQYAVRRLAPEHKLVTIPPALPAAPPPGPAAIAEVRARHQWSDAHRHVVTVTRLSDQKRTDELLQCWPLVLDRAPDARLWIVGDGPERAKLESMAAHLGITGACRFLGYQLNSRDFMAAADVMVMTSMYESFGYAALEACSCGTPIVASRVDGILDIIRHGVEGYLVAPGNRAEMAARIVELLDQPELRAAMGARGRERAAEFDPERVYPPWLEILRSAPRGESAFRTETT
jgi:glycosyltransferase involved in cell wall biosynthesis